MSSALLYGGMAGLQLYSAYSQAETIREQAALNQEVANMNAKYAELDAFEAEKMGYTQVSRYQNVIDQTIGQQRTIQAAQGVDTSFGTAAEVEQETRLTGYLNSLDLIKQAKANAKGLRIEASNIRLGSFMQGVQGQLDASAAMTQGVMNAANTGLSGYAKYKKGQSQLAKPSTSSSSLSSRTLNDVSQLQDGSITSGFSRPNSYLY